MSDRPLRDTAWAPPNLRSLLKIGARVQVRTHNECKRGGVDHGYEVDGELGTVAFYQREETDHPYAVVLDVSAPHWNYFAAVELEPLEDA